MFNRPASSMYNVLHFTIGSRWNDISIVCMVVNLGRVSLKGISRLFFFEVRESVGLKTKQKHLISESIWNKQNPIVEYSRVCGQIYGPLILIIIVVIVLFAIVIRIKTLILAILIAILIAFLVGLSIETLVILMIPLIMVRRLRGMVIQR